MCWGGNRYWNASTPYGRLGNGSFDTPYATAVPAAVAGGYQWKDIAPARHGVCGLRTDNVVMCWGNNFSASPSAIGGADTFIDIAATTFGFCGIRESDSQLMCWDDPGDTPVLKNGGVQFSKIDMGGYYEDDGCGIALDGSAWCWTMSTDPALVPGGYTWKSVSVGNNSNCGIRTDDVGMCWGQNWGYEFGDGTNTPSATPVLISGGYLWREIQVGQLYTCGTQLDGTYWCWGEGWYGEYGTGNYSTSTVPIQINHTQRWIQLSAGDGYHCALSADNDAYCWGWSPNGEIGNGKLPYQTVLKSIGCNNPNRSTGTLIYKDDFDTLSYCRNGQWIAVGK